MGKLRHDWGMVGTEGMLLIVAGGGGGGLEVGVGVRWVLGGCNGGVYGGWGG